MLTTYAVKDDINKMTVYTKVASYKTTFWKFFTNPTYISFT